MLFITNRYDALQAKAKRLRTKSERKTEKCDSKQKKIDAKIARLKTKSREVSYKKQVYCANISCKLKDVNSLISNERERITADKLEEDYNKATYDGKVKK